MLFIMKNLRFIAPIIIIALVAGGSYNLGVRLTEAEYERELLKVRKVQDSLVLELDKATKKIKQRKAVDVKTIYVEKDPTGCADTAVPDRLLEAIVGSKSIPDKEL